MLPIPDRPAPGLTTYDAKDPDTAYPADRAVAAAGGRAERAGRAARRRGVRRRRARSAVRAGRRRPSGWRRAGCRYNRFHTTALCAPTRQALLTGRNHHSVGMGSITETATSAPGNSSLRPNTKAPLAMTLKLNGYSTAQFGKCHEVPVWQSSPMGPFDAWPSGGGGFETFYGFIGGENNQWDPALYDGTTPVEPPATAGGGLPPDRGPGRPGGELGAPAEGADAGQAVLRLLRPGRDARPAPRAEGVGRQVRRSVRRRLGRAARAHLRPAEGAGGHPGRRRADRAARRDHGVGRHARRAQAGAGAADGGVRRVPGAHRPPRRPADRRDRRPRASSTTRSSTTSSATTARRPRAP